MIEKVKGLGVTLAHQAVTAAMEKGCSIEELQAHLGYYEAHRDFWCKPEGVLYDHLMKLQPRRPAAEGWASFDPAKEAEVQKQRDRDSQVRLALKLISDAEGSDDYQDLREAAIDVLDGDTTNEEAIQWYMKEIVTKAPLRWHSRLRLAADAARLSSSIGRSTTGNPRGATAAAATTRSASAVGMA